MTDAGPDPRTDLALVQLVGAVAYGQLRAWSAAAASVPAAPDVATSEQLAELTGRSWDLWRAWRAHLDTLTDLPTAVVERQRGAFDDFFAGGGDDWEHACIVLAFSWPIAQDFTARLAPRLPSPTRELALELAAGDDGVADFALGQLAVSVHDDADRDRVRSRVAELVGRALAGYQRAVLDTDALEVLLDDGGDEGTRRLAIDVMASHHRRLAALGLDDPA
jgi:hypothetical protein